MENIRSPREIIEVIDKTFALTTLDCEDCGIKTVCPYDKKEVTQTQCIHTWEDWIGGKI